METAPKITLPLSVFISYASVPKDEALLRELEAHLSLLKKLGLITTWHHKKILAGSNVQQELSEHLETATLILLLISADLLASEEYDHEIQTALERNKAGEALVIPILLRKVHLGSTSLKDLQCLPRDGRPVNLWEDADEAFTTIVAEIRETIEKYPTHQGKRISDKEKRLRALIPDHNGFLKDRLESFVGRQQELAEVQDLITQRLPIGGYITITGQAGQGKSNIIAKLIEIYGVEQVAYHFIPINPGPDHQVGLLRNLMARLILKYDLSDLYVASDNRAALHDYFPKVLTDVANQGGQEIICIDGLDQLEEDANGVRDLSFLPTNPPTGIVFVLGTRPNDTMKPLELLKPHNEYRLPNLSRQDFTLILEHRQVPLEKHLADQLYQAMEENALYLDLVARELIEHDTIDPLAIISRVVANPANVFTLSFERLQRQESLWERVIYPVLGVLLVAQEPLSLSCIKDILQVEQYKLRDGLTKLGGLLTQDHQQKYSLFHLKLRDYLRQNVDIPQNDALFSTEEEEQWHGRLAQWCERGDLSQIWQDVKEVREQQRRIYVRQHYITHLYYAHKWQELFEVLDEGSYGHAKERYDVSTRSYLQDLDRGRQAAVQSGTTLEEVIAMLPYLWRYTLLHGSLRSHADQYPNETFQLLLLLGREQEVLGLVELLTDVQRKVEILLLVAQYLEKQSGREMECEQIYFRAFEVAYQIGESRKRARALRGLVRSFAKVRQWERAEKIAHGIEDSEQRAWALSEFAKSLVQVRQWEKAEKIAHGIEDHRHRAWALSELAKSLAQAQQWERAEELWREVKEIAHGIEDSEQRTWALSELAVSLAQVQQWERAEELWKEVEEIVYGIEDGEKIAWALSELAVSLAQVQQWERAEEVAQGIRGSYQQAEALRQLAKALAQGQQWKRAEEVARSIKESEQQAEALRQLAGSLVQAQQWERAEEIARGIEENKQRVEALSELAGSLVEIQQRKWATVICAEVENAIRLVKRGAQEVEVFSELAVSLAQMQQWERAKKMWKEAEEVACGIEDSKPRTSTLSELVKSLANGQQWERAERAARGIEENVQREEALRGLAKSLAQKQQWERAKKVALSMGKSIFGMLAWTELFWSLAQMQQWERAEEIAWGIEDSEQRAWALSELAVSMAQGQKWERAEEITRGIEKSFLRKYVWGALAVSLAQAQQWERAEEIARGIEDSEQRAKSLKALAVSLAQAQQWERAEEAARSIKDGEQWEEALRELAASLAQGQKWERAEKLWGELEEIARGKEEDERRAEALEKLARSLAQVQQWERAEEIARSIEEDEQRIWTLRVLVKSLAQAQQWERVEEIAQSMGTDVQQAALGELAKSLAQAQQWERAEEIARSLRGSYQQAEALGELAKSLAQAQQWERAEEIAWDMEESYQRERVLRTLADSLCKVYRYEQVISLIHSSWLQAETRYKALCSFPLVLQLLPLQPEIGDAFYRGFQWVDAFLKG